MFNCIKQKKVLVLWYTYKENYGDVLIYSTVKSYLEKWGYTVDYMDVGLPYLQIAKQAKKYDFLWFAGGGIIERGVPDIIVNFPTFHKKAGKIPYGVTGLSIGIFHYDEYKSSISFWVEKSLFFYSRDEYTSNELNRISNSSKVISGVDVVFANTELATLKTINDSKVGISIRDLPYTDLSGSFHWNEWKKSLKESLGNKMIGIPDQHDCIRFLDIPFDSDYKPFKVTELLQSISYTVAMRYHVILVAAIMGKVSIPIGYCPKVSRLAEQLGIEELEIGVHDWEKVKSMVMKYHDDEESLKNAMNKNVLRMRNEALFMFHTVEQKIKGETV